MEKSASSAPESSRVALVICPHAGMMAEVLPILSHSLPDVRPVPIKTYLDPAALRERFSTQTPVLCLLDVETDLQRAQGVIGEVLELVPGLAIVILLERNDPSLILQCLRHGASEFLLRPITAEDLQTVLARLSPTSPALHYGKGGRVICVAPAKGACGASTIACNLALLRRQLGSDKTLLADLDLFTGIVAFLLKVKSPYSFLDALSRSTSLDEDLWRGIVTSRGGLDILPAPDNPMEAMGELQDPTPLIEFVRQHYDTVIIDSAGILGRWELNLASACDELLLITTNELPAVQATQRALLHLERNRIERSKIRLVVNRYTRGVGLGKESIATALHADIYHVLPSDYDAAHRSLVEARAIPTNSPVGRGLSELAERLSGRGPQPAARVRNSWTGILSSLFSKATL